MPNSRFIKQRLGAIAACAAGTAYIEFALSITVLLIMLFGAIEVSRYILIVQKVEKTIDTLTDVFTQSVTTDVTASQINQYLNATQTLMNPYTFGASGIVYITYVDFPAGSTTPTVEWQVCGGGTLAAASNIGAPGATANLAPLGGYTMDANENEKIVIGEIFYNFAPILLQNIISPAQVYRVAVFKPRYVSLSATSSLDCP